MDMLPNMIVERLLARRADPLAERPAEAKPIPEFRQYTRLSPPRRRRNLVSQNSVPTPSTLSPFTSVSGANLPESSVSLPASPSDSQVADGSHHWQNKCVNLLVNQTKQCFKFHAHQNQCDIHCTLAPKWNGQKLYWPYGMKMRERFCIMYCSI